jgi:UDP-glucose:(heptosyl)LPS alpha-1,3-glucosyltransferase
VKIALIRKKYSAFGGAERYVDSLVGHLLELGHEIHIFANKWESATHNLQTLRGLNSSATASETGGLFFHRVPMIKGLSVLKVLSFAINVQRLIRKESFDVVHSFERTLHQDIYRAGDGCHKEWLIQRAKHEPIWKTFLVRSNPLHWSFLWIEKQLFEHYNTKIVIANSQRGKEEIIRHYGFPADRICVIYNGVDNTRFHPNNRKRFRKAVRNELNLAEDDRVMLFLGSGFERKGLKYAIEALGASRDEKTKLIVAGRDNPRKYQRHATRLGIADRVLFNGPTQEPERLYAVADVFVLPTIYEPFSNACVEALASGLSVVTSRINGASELIEEGITGVSVEDPSDAERLRDAVERLLQHGNNGAVKWAETRGRLMGIRDHVKQTVGCYVSMVNQYNEDKDS